jgi:hypothetical protein
MRSMLVLFAAALLAGISLPASAASKPKSPQVTSLPRCGDYARSVGQRGQGTGTFIQKAREQGKCR